MGGEEVGQEMGEGESGESCGAQRPLRERRNKLKGPRQSRDGLGDRAGPSPYTEALYGISAEPRIHGLQHPEEMDVVPCNPTRRSNL